MNNLSLSKRIWLPAIITTCVILAMALFTALRTSSQVVAIQAEQAVFDEKTHIAEEWRALTLSNAARVVAVLSSTDLELGKALKADTEATTSRISELQKRLEALAAEAPGPQEKDALAAVGKARAEYIALRKDLTAKHAAGGLDGAALDKLRASLKAYDATQQAFLKVVDQEEEAAQAAQADSRMRNVWLISGILLSLGAMLLVSAFYTTRAVVVPLTQAVSVTRRVAAGDLGVHITTDRGDEIGELLKSLGEMGQALRRLITEVRDGANNIQLASAEIATGNTDLSARTEQTASNLQETSSSMQQLTGTVRQSADAASQANQLASSAAQAAERGGAVVAEVVTNMEDISSSSRKIGDIISVIDGIAFQTNILALNAAVEAARAGEQGRGFAVVAGEVRTLAGRSAEAAREIKSLIGASVEKVENGARLVQGAGATMAEIVGSVRRVSDIIGEITASAAEQRDGIDQVNQAVTQLDAMTQQNAALVEQSAAAADSMKQQAHRLAEVVSAFRLESAAP
jgi:methyl-accepting chemotaxis protein